MQFHLDYTPPPSDFKISHKDFIFLIGSCFSENIGHYLSSHKFKTLSNPNGILFNPASISKNLRDILNQKQLDERYILERDGLFFSYQHHSSVNASDKAGLLDKINSINSNAYGYLKKTKVLIITFGSGFVYDHRRLDETVGNCHKQPDGTFLKRLLNVNDIVTSYSRLLLKLKQLNPNLKIVFTVSPVKYLKDGVVENNRSKATLLLAVNELIKNENCIYFPAYELVNDDLRDYRFYKTDLAHPNEQAIEYVWSKFSDCFFSDKTKALNKEIHKLNLALAHNPMNASSEENKKLEGFIKMQEEEIRKLGL